jgi:hypothetical protein
MQHTEAVRDKSAVENRSRNLLEKLMVVEAEKEDLDRRLVAEREDVEKDRAKAQAARAEANLALKRAIDVESGQRSLRGYVDKTAASTHAGVDRAHTLLMEAYRQLGARTAPFDKSGEEVGLRFLGWLQEELELLPSIVTSLMSFTLLITYEGATNALSCEGCRHFKVFDRATKDFDRGIFQVEDEVLKRSARALYDRMWGPHGRDTVWERSDRALEEVCKNYLFIYYFLTFLLFV